MADALSLVPTTMTQRECSEAPLACTDDGSVRGGVRGE